MQYDFCGYEFILIYSDVIYIIFSAYPWTINILFSCLVKRDILYFLQICTNKLTIERGHIKPNIDQMSQWISDG